jgi:serine/threonine protein kinase
MQFGRYRFVDRLAVGGMAEVFVAVAHGDEGFEKPVVIKRLLPQLAAFPRFLQMFLDEARIMLSLQHGNIVQILDMGRMEGLPFLTLEYVDGKDLRTVLGRLKESGQSLPHGLAAHIACEVCRGLDYAHRKTDDDGQPLHIVHRDVNPANIFLSHEGEVKVGDFGLAKARDNLDHSEAGIIKGKLAYLAPEQAEGQAFDHRADIFALGTTLYEIACGRRPFEGPNDVDVVMQIREARVVRPSELVAGFNRDLEAVILKAMEKDPARRYQTASHMREELTQFLQRIPSPPGDRELAAYLNGLFPERRSKSAVFKLAPLISLPPPMASVSKVGGISEYQQAHVEDALLPSWSQLQGRAPAAPAPSAAPAVPPVAPAPRAPIPAPPATTAAAVTRRRLTALPIALVLLLLAGGAVALYLTLLRPARASLSLTSAPAGATILLDGVDTGQRTPARLEGLALDRDHSLSLRHAETAEVRRSFRFERGGEHRHHFVLGLERERLTVTSTPPACDLLVDEELRGQTPLTLQLPRGRKYVVQLRKVGFLPKVIQHYAELREATLQIALDPEPEKKPARPRPGPTPRTPEKGPALTGGTGVLEIDTALRGKVLIDGRLVGRTPEFRLVLPAGSYSVTVIPDGTKIKHSATITVSEKQTHRLRLTGAP